MYKQLFNKTKIVATIGPATSSYEMLKKIILAGVDVCRLNFSHGEHEEYQEIVNNIRAINAEFNSNICILQDLQGPKLRVGEMQGEGVLLETGKTVTITTRDVIGTSELFQIRYAHFGTDAKPGEKVLLDDGRLELVIDQIIDAETVLAKIIVGGVLKSRKGFNLPDTDFSIPCLTEKDLHDLKFAIKNDIEWVGLSFVRKPEDIIELKEIIRESGKNIKVVAKIEKPQAIKHIDDIITVTDAVMVARGDLGVEMPMQEVPLLQKKIVEKSVIASKPVIIATQMMESMINSPVPTRAEVNDVANAVLDGADAVMLSAETSVGKYPEVVVETMEKIIRDVEKDKRVYFKGIRPNSDSSSFLSDEICFTAVRMSDHLNAKVIAGMTRSGYTGYKVASFRPKADIVIFTDNLPLLNTMNLVWGVRGFFYDKFESSDQTFSDIIDILRANGFVERGDRVIHTSSMPIHKKQRTNAIKVSVAE